MVFTSLMGKRDLTLHQGWEDNALEDIDKWLNHALKESQDQEEALNASHKQQMMSLKRWQSDRRANAETERDSMLTKYMDKMTKIYDEEQECEEEEWEISDLIVSYQPLKNEVQAEEARHSGHCTVARLI